MNRSTILYLLITSLFYLSPIITTPAQTVLQVSGDITQNTSWTDDTIKVTGEVIVADDVTLTINPDTYVEFQGHYKLKVYGTILALGTPEEYITFTINDTTGFSDFDVPDGGWNGVRFDNYSGSGGMYDNDTSRFDYCILEYGKGVGGPLQDRNGGAFWFQRFSKLIISNCIIRNNYSDNGSFIFGNYGSPVIRNNRVYNNYGGSILGFNSNTDPLISNNIICNNRGIAITVSYGNPIIYGNIICNNGIFWSYPVYGGGTGINIATCNATIVNNTICNNESGALGGGLFFRTSIIRFDNNIVYGNKSAEGGHQFWLDGKNIMDLRNCIIEPGDSSIQGEPYTGQLIDCLSSDPDFVKPSSGIGYNYDGLNADWNILSTSPAINNGITEENEQYLSGTDYYGNERIHYGMVDIGAAEFIQNYIQVSDNVTSNTLWRADTVRVKSDIIVENGNTLTIPPGTRVEFQGWYWLIVEGTLVAKGTEKENITFTAIDTNYFSIPDSLRGGWRGIRFNETNETNDSSIIKYCVFEYGKALHPSNYSYRSGAGLYINKFSKLLISHCEFRNNIATDGCAIYCNRSDILISNNTFYNNACVGSGSPRGSALMTVESNLVFRNNYIYNNTSISSAAGIYISGYIAKPLIINNLIYNNYAKIGAGMQICGNAWIVNNTICNNQTIERGGGICIQSADPDIINCILRGNIQGQNEDQIDTYGFENPRIYNCNIQGGLQDINHGIGAGVFIDNIDQPAEFLNPTGIYGPDENAPAANWRVNQFSPGINAGKTAISGLTLPGSDLDGLPRIVGTTIDIGAYEHQGNLPQIVTQPVGRILCEGKSFSISVETVDSAIYQWQKDGVDIPGEINSDLIIDNVTSTAQGNYWCIVSNAYGLITSNTATLFVNESPEFLQEPQDVWAQKGKSVLLRTYAKGTNPDFQWQKDGAGLPGKVTPELNISNVDYPDEGEYRCIISNTCGSDTTSSSLLYLTPQICMVTVDPATGNNLVVWEKNSIAPYQAYYVYRESQAAGIFDLMDTIPHSDLSVYVDTSADPTVQAYIYKITGVDDTGYETELDLCYPHKTIHLLVSTNPELNTTQLEWDKYYGFEYSTYIIYRSPTGTGFTPIHYMASTLNSWTDPSPLAGIGFYRINVEKPHPCVPAGGGKKADPGPYSHAMSNMEDNRLQETGENQEPTEIHLSDSAVDENLSIGSFVGRLETTDPDTIDHHVYKLVNGTGDNDNHRFTILGDLVVTAEELDFETRDTCLVRIKTIDKGDLYLEQEFMILVNDVDETVPNEAPVDITISSQSVKENKQEGSLVGKLWTDDPDVFDDHTYAFVTGPGGDDNNRFMILDDLLLTDEPFDFETRDTLYIRIRSTDKGDLQVEKAFIIVVTDVDEVSGNHAPTGIALSSNTIDENRLSGTMIGTFTTTDPDMGDVHAYTLVEGLGGDDNDGLMIMGNILISWTEFDYESKDTLFIRVASSDLGGLSYEKTFIILVNDVFEAAPNLSPTDITLSTVEIDENKSALTLIGRFQTTDPNMDDLHTYLMVEGTGDDDNGSFILVGDALFSAYVFDYEMKDEYHIRIRSTDNGEGSLTTEKTFTIGVNDLLELSLSEAANGTDGISIYPNPFTDATTFKFPNPDRARFRLTVTDLAGKVVNLEDNIYTDQIEFSRKDLPAGVYFVELRGDGIYRSRMVIE
jgi:hypothetical protein